MTSSKYIAALSFILASALAKAEHFVYVTNNLTSRIYIDVDSVKHEKSFVKAWARSNVIDPKDEVITAKFLMQFDCVKREYLMLREYYYGRNGELLHSRDPSTDVNPIVPGTQSARLAAKVCP